MQHFKISLSVFIDKLRKSLDKRIAEFEDYAQNDKKTELKTKEEWIDQYKQWTAMSDIEKEIFKYMKD